MEIAKYKKRTKRKKQNMIRIQYLVSLLEKCQHQKSETWMQHEKTEKSETQRKHERWMK